MLQPYQPQLETSQLVRRLNVIFHNYEARDYDRQHHEIVQQLPQYWRMMCEQIPQRLPTQALSILDFGCGTGFAAEMILQFIPREQIASLTCYDPSAAMLAKCEQRIGRLFPSAKFISNWDARGDVPHNLLITNSVLHHLPSLAAMMAQILPRLSSDALWLAGHEPSRRFYQNAACVEAFSAMVKERQWRKYFSLANYQRRLKQALRLTAHPAARTAEEAYRQGLFGRKPPPQVINRLVDFHVPHSVAEVEAGIGFDFAHLAEKWHGQWELVWVQTYAFMGAFYTPNLPAKWRQHANRLQREFPNDGANFCAVWQR